MNTTLETPARSLGLAGASNFRDLGGYGGSAGASVRWRRLFRSDHLAGLTEADAQALAQLGVARAFDFRGVAERAAQPYALPGVVQHALPIEPTVVQRMKALAEAGETITPAHAVALMQDTYRAFVSDNAARFAELFGHLLDSDAPLVFHCTAGKDRTGWAIALLQWICGATDAEVQADYLLSNAGMEVAYRPMLNAFAAEGGDAEALADMIFVRPEYLDAAMSLQRRLHGGLDGYLRESLGLTAAEVDALRTRLS